jgi:hypothetical protein
MRQSPIVLLPACALLLLTFACATSPRVTLDLFRGVYSTHFEGIPDQAAICAVLTNRTNRAVDWTRLRLRAYPTYGEKEARWTSSWIYRGRLLPGETKAVALRLPPVADQIELEVRSAGRGEGPESDRPAVAVKRCSESWLQHRLKAAREGRTAPGMALYPIVRRNDLSVEVLLARER